MDVTALGIAAAWVSDFKSWTRLAQLKLCPVTEPHRGFVLSQVPILRFATELRLGHPAHLEAIKRACG
jgi:hypothetical protein